MTPNEISISLSNETESTIPVSEESILDCVIAVGTGEQKEFSLVEIVYVTAEKIAEINSEHLGKTYVTDIITFDYTDSEEDEIEGTLFCCESRIAEQAIEFNEPLNKEFHRIIINGLLHLCGYQDATEDLKKQMSEKEDFYLTKISL